MKRRGRKRTYSDALAARAIALHRKGMTLDAVCTQLASEFSSVPSRATVARIFQRGKAEPKKAKAKRKTSAKKKTTKKRATKAAKSDGSEGLPKGAVMTNEEQRAALSALMRATVRDAKAARRKRDSGSSLAYARQVVALAQVMTRIPEDAPLPDPNERPDMIAAAESGRAKLFEYCAKATAGK